MDGVTILQVIEKAYLPDWTVAIILACVFIGIMLAITTILLCIDHSTSAFITLGLTLVCIIVAIFMFQVPKITDINYRVLVDNTVDMNEFFSKYELIRTEGLIYVVREISGI